MKSDDADIGEDDIDDNDIKGNPLSMVIPFFIVVQGNILQLRYEVVVIPTATGLRPLLFDIGSITKGKVVVVCVTVVVVVVWVTRPVSVRCSSISVITTGRVDE